MDGKVKVGIVGCGAISSIYLAAAERFKFLEIVACADLDMDRAMQMAQKFNIPIACSAEDLLSDSEIDIVLNLTVPVAHADVALRALGSGKHVYSEKPLAVTRNDGKDILKKAREKGLLAGCAPDTFLGGGFQTCRKVIDDGLIGAPLAATAFMMCRGPESGHPDPEFFYKPGGGPLFDMGPYYLTAMISMFGPVRKVAGMSKQSFSERRITSSARYGQLIKVEVPTHIMGMLEFENGMNAALITSFDVCSHALPKMEIYGEEGSIGAPDPNSFGGPVKLCRFGEKQWHEIPLTHGRKEQWRSVGLADMAKALTAGRPHRANAEMGFHVLDVMLSILESSEKGSSLDVKSSCSRPEPLPSDLADDELD